MPLKSSARRLLYRRYGTAKAYNRLASASRHRGAGTPVVVHTMGKVGSQSVVASLHAAGLGRRVYHVHHLSDAAVQGAEAVYRAGWGAGHEPDHLWDSHHLRRLPPPGRDGAPPWKVVTLVRDPVARNVSSFFQVGDLQYGLDYADLGRRGADPGVVRELAAAFLDRFAEHDVPLTWFDRELRDVFGVDVVREPFDPSRGWARFPGARADVLVVALERLADVAAPAFGDWLELPDFRVVGTNIGGDKHYGELYRRFVREVALPEAYVDRLYAAPEVRHFYTDAALDGFRRRWLDRPRVRAT